MTHARQVQIVLASLIVAGAAGAQPQVLLPPQKIPQFVDPLPVLDLAGGPIRTVIAGADEIELHMREFRAAMMPSTFVPPGGGAYEGTWVWGYTVGAGAPVGTQGTYTGPVIVATRNVPTQMRFQNDLGLASSTNVLAWYYATDQTLHWADPLNGGANVCSEMAMERPGEPPLDGCGAHYDGPIPGVVHLHGGDVPPVLDGGPNAWFTSDGAYHGPAYYTRPGVPVAGNQAVYRYPNTQEAAPTWFHDHVLGFTRLNVYAGLAGAYDIIDPGLTLPAGLDPVGLRQGAGGALDFIIPVVIQDRSFDVNGQLYFPAEGENVEHPFWVPEFLGDVIAVNGKVWPYLNLEARRYRFLFVNGSNARTYELALTDFQTSASGPALWQIGTDGGYLDAPVRIDPVQVLRLMPGERADIIIDFAGFAGSNLLVRNTARAPYPLGTPPNGRTAGRVMQVRVGLGPAADLSYDPASGVPIRPKSKAIVRLADPNLGTVAPGVTVSRVRQLTLNEVMGSDGPLEVLVNNTLWTGTNRPDFTPIAVDGQTAYVSELPAEGSTEVWEIVNLTADAHPIHTHLTQVQLMNRQKFNARRYEHAYEHSFPGGEYLAGFGPPLDYATGNPSALGGNPDVTPYLQGPPLLPALNEAGWKDTVMTLPGQVTRFVLRYAPMDKPVGDPEMWYPFDPAAEGRGYVWHCHIIDHEDNEMMRPFYVVPRAGASRTYLQGIDY